MEGTGQVLTVKDLSGLMGSEIYLRVEKSCNSSISTFFVCFFVRLSSVSAASELSVFQRVASIGDEDQESIT